MAWKITQSLFLTLFTIVSFFANAETLSNLQLRNSPLNDMFFDNVIRCIERDRLGFLWICTPDGLYKYTGTNITKYSPLNRNKNWLNNTNVRQLFVGSNGNLYVATYGGGISKYSTEKDSFFPITQQSNIEYSHIDSIAETEEHIWFTTPFIGVGAYKKNTGTFEEWPNNNSLNTSLSEPSDLIVTSSGEIWFGGENGLYRIRPTTKNIGFFPNNRYVDIHPNKSITTTLEQLSDDNILLGAYSGQSDHPFRLIPIT